MAGTDTHLERPPLKRAKLIAELGLFEENPARGNGRWEAITISQLAGFLGCVLIFCLALILSEPGFILLLDHANLLFHEAGHPIYGLLSTRLAVYGGTLGQLTFPAVLAISFYRKAQPIPFASCCIWFFENLLNIARYLADARAQLLPLVGGGEHDWTEILTRWNLLSADTTLAAIVRSLGWIGMLASIVWILFLAVKGRRSHHVAKP